MHILLLIGIQVIVLCHNTEGVGVYRHDNLKYDNAKIENYDQHKVKALLRMLEQRDQNDLRNIKDVWESIKTAAQNAGGHIKNMVNNAKEKITILIQNLKGKAAVIQEEFEQRLRKVQDKMNAFIEKAKGASQVVKKCLQDEKESIEGIVKAIISNVTTCIAENTMRVSALERQLAMDIDEKEFVNSVEDKISACVDKEDIDVECLYTVRENMIKDVEHIEEEVFASRMESRNVADDILSTIFTCSAEGLVAASSNITTEAIEIIKCVSDSATSTQPSVL